MVQMTGQDPSLPGWVLLWEERGPTEALSPSVTVLTPIRGRFVFPVCLLHGVPRDGHLASLLHRDLWLSSPRGLEVKVGSPNRN